ncbi:MAG: YitT family protein [Actinomycetes bacterium]
MQLTWLAPSRTVVVTRWRNEGSRWRTNPQTFFVLLVGLWLFGTGEALLLNAGLGVSPWTVLAQGIYELTGMSIGWATFVISLIVLLAWIPLHEKLGLGTVSNAIFLAFALQVMLGVLPHPHLFVLQLLESVAGIAAIGLASGLYLTTNLGPGPRDGMMTGLHTRTGISVARVRLAIEVCVLAIGWMLGGTIGLGTLLFALFIGASVGYGLKFCGWIGRPSNAIDSAGVIVDEHPELEA